MSPHRRAYHRAPQSHVDVRGSFDRFVPACRFPPIDHDPPATKYKSPRLIEHHVALCPATYGALKPGACPFMAGALLTTRWREIHMRALLAARAIAAALVLVPIQARLDPLAYTIESESDAQATVAQSNQGPREDSSGSAGMSADAICAALDRSASQNDLPLDFFTRLIWQESRFNPFSVSRAGARGIAQFMPGTAHRIGLSDPFDPIEALPKSAELLRDLRTKFGNLGLAAAAHNAG
jgi:soluble lytic murein transglycosylase-like protein